MRRECRERFPRHRLQWKPLVNDPDMHHGTWVTHVPWCMSGPLTRGGEENVPGISGACATRNFTYLVRGPFQMQSVRQTVSYSAIPLHNVLLSPIITVTSWWRRWRIKSLVQAQITGVSMVCSTVCSSADHRKHQSSWSLEFVRGIHRWLVNSHHKEPVTRKCFHLMTSSCTNIVTRDDSK